MNRTRLAAALSGCLLASGASAADLPPRAAPPLPAAALPAFTWTGFYVGANAGAGFGMGRGSFTDPTYGPVTSSGGSGAAFVGGGQVGFNYQFAPGSGLVIGAEADIMGVAGGSRPRYAIGAASLYDVGPSLDWMGTVRGRVGWAFDRLLVYGTAGLAYGGGGRATVPSSYPYALSDGVRTGYAVGGGVEYAVTPSISARIEGLYVNLGRGGSAATVLDAASAAYYGTTRRDDAFGLVRAGVNYRF